MQVKPRYKCCKMNLEIRREENQFTLTYKYNTPPEFQFIRKGSEQDPLYGELRHGRLLKDRQDQYERAMVNRRRKKVDKPPDFILDQDGCIDRENSSGLNLLPFSTLPIYAILNINSLRSEV